jgi:membrane-bound serine protease (ClpP class)
MTLIITLVLAGFALILVEIFLPGLIAGTLGLFVLLGALIASGIHYGTEGVIWTLIAEVALGAVLFALWMKYFPKSSLGRRFSLPDPEPQHASSTPATVSVGQKGTTLTPLRPSGSARIEGRRVDVIAEGTHLDAGVEVTVVKVAGPAIVVRATSKPAPGE